MIKNSRQLLCKNHWYRYKITTYILLQVRAAHVVLLYLVCYDTNAAVAAAMVYVCY